MASVVRIAMVLDELNYLMRLYKTNEPLDSIRDSFSAEENAICGGDKSPIPIAEMVRLAKRDPSLSFSKSIEIAKANSVYAFYDDYDDNSFDCGMLNKVADLRLVRPVLSRARQLTKKCSVKDAATKTAFLTDTVMNSSLERAKEAVRAVIERPIPPKKRHIMFDALDTDVEASESEFYED